MTNDKMTNKELIDKLKKTLDLLKEQSVYLDSDLHQCKGDCER